MVGRPARRQPGRGPSSCSTSSASPMPEERCRQYPHEFSGGMRQRAMIAMAIANDPKILVADEATTALDVTIQAQILEILEIAREETHAATILITHDLGLVAELADRVVVMYAGRVAEIGDCDEIFRMPAHPYTEGLLGSIPVMGGEPRRLRPIPGQPPSLTNLPSGCAFHPRCARSANRALCRDERPEPLAGRSVARVGMPFLVRDDRWAGRHAAPGRPQMTESRAGRLCPGTVRCATSRDRRPGRPLRRRRRSFQQVGPEDPRGRGCLAVDLGRRDGRACRRVGLRQIDHGPGSGPAPGADRWPDHRGRRRCHPPRSQGSSSTAP